MAHIVNIQLSLDVKIKGGIGHHILNLRHLALESRLVHRQEAVPLHADPHRLTSLHIFCLDGYHPSDGGLHQTDGFIELLAFIFRQLCFQHSIQHLVGIV